MIYVLITCKECGTDHTLSATKEEIEKWKGGALVQRAFPNMSPEQREMFISGICPECWEKIFPKEDE